MFAKLFSESGLSLDRLKALVEVGAAGSIVQAAGSDLARQSQYSRQIKELEDFFQIGLAERHGKGIRLTAGGKELARISRFFLLGLSNFQRGCLAEGQTYRIGGGATFLATFLLPLLAEPVRAKSGIRYSVETVQEEDIERRLRSGGVGWYQPLFFLFWLGMEVAPFFRISDRGLFDTKNEELIPCILE